MDKDKITRLKIILKHLKETKGLNLFARNTENSIAH